jgi:hypothetical protein
MAANRRAVAAGGIQPQRRYGGTLWRRVIKVCVLQSPGCETPGGVCSRCGGRRAACWCDSGTDSEYYPGSCPGSTFGVPGRMGVRSVGPVGESGQAPESIRVLPGAQPRRSAASAKAGRLPLHSRPELGDSPLRRS